MKYRVDRIEEGHAVCFDDGENKLIIAPDKLPENVTDGTLLDIITDADGNIISVTINEPDEADKSRTDSMKSRLDALLKRNKNNN